MSSGSRRAESSVEPTRSQNITVRWRRSASRRSSCSSADSGRLNSAIARSILRRWPSRTPSQSKSWSVSSGRTPRSMPFSAKRSAYCPSPNFSSQSAISCIGFTGGQLAACRILDYCSRDVMPLFPEWHVSFCTNSSAVSGYRIASVAQLSRYDQRRRLIGREFVREERMTVLDRERNQEAFADAGKSGSAI